ncbi:CLUMA_CG005991, isoform A [Clunio marinus]|uniref:CLUMA_CG005991, isoform A n=1 Tax=Clunio marinus TaxID=568069 RepID=A0A1J1HXZ4_9DIPT|nr:CLUMA_CG005991, isoform A [Clunio marinus]
MQHRKVTTNDVEEIVGVTSKFTSNLIMTRTQLYRCLSALVHTRDSNVNGIVVRQSQSSFHMKNSKYKRENVPSRLNDTHKRNFHHSTIVHHNTH